MLQRQLCDPNPSHTFIVSRPRPAQFNKSAATDQPVILSAAMDRFIQPINDHEQVCPANQRPRTSPSNQLAATDRSIKPISGHTDTSVQPTSGRGKIPSSQSAATGSARPANQPPHRQVRLANQRPRISPSSQSAATQRSIHQISGHAPQINVFVQTPQRTPAASRDILTYCK